MSRSPSTASRVTRINPPPRVNAAKGSRWRRRRGGRGSGCQRFGCAGARRNADFSRGAPMPRSSRSPFDRRRTAPAGARGSQLSSSLSTRISRSIVRQPRVTKLTDARADPSRAISAQPAAARVVRQSPGASLCRLEDARPHLRSRARQPARSAAPSPRRAKTARTIPAAASPANAIATLTGEPARRPRPASSTGVTGLNLATV